MFPHEPMSSCYQVSDPAGCYHIPYQVHPLRAVCINTVHAQKSALGFKAGGWVLTGLAVNVSFLNCWNLPREQHRAAWNKMTCKVTEQLDAVGHAVKWSWNRKHNSSLSCCVCRGSLSKCWHDVLFLKCVMILKVSQSLRQLYQSVLIRGTNCTSIMSNQDLMNFVDLD